MEALHITGNGRYLLVTREGEALALVRCSTRAEAKAGLTAWKDAHIRLGSVIMEKGSGGFVAYDLAAHVQTATVQVYDLVGPKAETAEEDNTAPTTKKRRGKKAD